MGLEVGRGTGAEYLNMENRDPKNINDHLKIEFDDILAEPEGAHSNDCVWKCVYRCFSCGKYCCYRCLTLFCGCCFGLCWGCQFACVMFMHIWQFTPALRLVSINVDCMQKCWGTLLNCLLGPLCETFGLLFSKIGVTNIQG